MLSAGNPFPNFSLPNQDGKITKLSDFAGQWLVVYFYPKDDTPGCTVQGKALPPPRLTSTLPESRWWESAPTMWPRTRTFPQVRLHD